ncbi:hypothetical protein IFM89_005554 [Coptis chinensis]|uniref:Coenzyme Q-binding protein COQ10 START domain-containing protein n=1 Tax=Coptis chinensis TaxID=261450 RepID=A0A835LGK0_9MAGN|nr:hypothetical protein IFM89_005554 [Coptis chinensis]
MIQVFKTMSFVSSPTPFVSLPHSKPVRNNNAVVLKLIPTCTTSLRQPSLHKLFFFFFRRSNSNGVSTTSTSRSIRPFCPVMEWQDCSVRKEVDIPVSVAYDCYSDREAFPRWMPFISSVKPIPNQKIHWRSLEGLPNRYYTTYNTDV